VLALTENTKADLLQGSNCLKVVNARNLRHGYTATLTSRTS
jgi:hypothetical protein